MDRASLNRGTIGSFGRGVLKAENETHGNGLGAKPPADPSGVEDDHSENQDLLHAKYG